MFERFARGVSSVLFVAMFCLFAFKIVMRYAFGDAVAWGDELGVILFLWVIFWSCALVVRDREQIVFDLAVNAVPRPVARGFAIFRNLLIGGLFAFALPTIAGYLQFLTRSQTAVLRWPVGWVYSCFGLLAAAIVVRAVCALIKLCRPGWESFV